MLNKEQAYYLLQKLMDGKASSAERATLSQLLQQNYPQEQWIELMEELYHVQSQTEQPVYNEAEWKPVLEQLLQNVRIHNPKVIPMWKRIAVAASIVGVLFVGYWMLRPSTTLSPSTDGPSTVAQDVPAPDKNRAQIKLADGTIVYLDSAGNGSLATQSNVVVKKTADGQIVYETTVNGQQSIVQYNTLSNPRGSKVIDMTLSDGSRVWLNAGSSVTYPVAFVGNERKVNITGEAYFEVAHNASKPFFVSKGDVSVQVLGTHFNVNAYDDESDVKVTLLEGSVKIASTSSRNDVLLKPGEQAQVANNIKVVKGVDTEQVMAWKNGLFNFSKTDIGSVMRQVSRWYDVDVEFEGIVPGGTYSGDVNRNTNVSNVLKILKLSGVNYRIESAENGRKKIVVMK